MASTLETSLISLLSTIDDTFEVIVVDDASTDDSWKILLSIATSYSNVRIFKLEKDKNRRLGTTRNIAIGLASTEWCIFHIDTDDFFRSGIKDFVRSVYLLDNKFQRDLLYAGSQIHMARKNFLESIGPFRNIYRGEDRDLYIRLIEVKRLIFIDHDNFIYPLPKSFLKKTKKSLVDSWDQLVTDLQIEDKFLRYLVQDLWARKRKLDIKIFIFNLFLLIPARLESKRRGRIHRENKNLDLVANYRNQYMNSFEGWMGENNF